MQIHLTGRRESVTGSRTMHPPKEIICSLLLLCISLPLACQESHQSEPVTGVLFMRSTFAHGYRHGYEAGYHQGNIDINMARPARAKFSELRGIALGYQSGFGPRNSFLYGFQYGLMAGYNDGYAGREFRAISTLRLAAAELDSPSPELKVRSSLFDKGLIFGYEDGFGQKPAKKLVKMPERPSGPGSCEKAQATEGPAAGETADYCEGYRRGLVLGQKDAFAARGEHGLLEASK
jgi:hypothetical protein